MTDNLPEALRADAKLLRDDDYYACARHAEEAADMIEALTDAANAVELPRQVVELRERVECAERERDEARARAEDLLAVCDVPPVRADGFPRYPRVCRGERYGQQHAPWLTMPDESCGICQRPWRALPSAVDVACSTGPRSVQRPGADEAEPSLSMVYGAIMELRAEVKAMAVAVERKATPVFTLTQFSDEATRALADRLRGAARMSQPRPEDARGTPGAGYCATCPDHEHCSQGGCVQFS